jgi:hypothetical protein
MTTRYSTRFAPDYRSPAWRAFVTSGLWLRTGFVAASIAAIALVMLVAGEANPWLAIASALAGATVAALAWRSALAVLDQADAAEAAGVTTDAAAAGTRAPAPAANPWLRADRGATG